MHHRRINRHRKPTSYDLPPHSGGDPASRFVVWSCRNVWDSEIPYLIAVTPAPVDQPA
ncbi:hypothetical protein MOKP125_21190 [Mycobacterium avium subsp. hominissuis]|nr:hypothetical protein N602_29505 [Mycobacterium avium subsp. hominissuis 10-5606]